MVDTRVTFVVNHVATDLNARVGRRIACALLEPSDAAFFVQVTASPNIGED